MEEDKHIFTTSRLRKFQKKFETFRVGAKNYIGDRAARNKKAKVIKSKETQIPTPVSTKQLTKQEKTQKEKPKSKPKVSKDRAEKLLTYLLLFAFVVIMGVGVFLTQQHARTKQENKRLALQKTTTVPTKVIITPTPSPITNYTANWKVYNNEELGFEIKYPLSVTLDNDTTTPKDNFVLNIIIQNFEETSDYTIGYGSNEFKEDLKSLKQGEYGSNIDFDYQDSRQVIKLDKVNAKVFTILGRFETCDVAFERKAIFYPDDTHRVIITLYGPIEKIEEENPSYFQQITDKVWLNCPNPSSNYGMDDFYNDLVADRLSNTADLWYRTFDQILSTFQFTN